jgi:LAO/AO transport system kinase
VVDTVCLLTLPGAGDDIQAIKAGIIEIADILVVNKGDRPGADEAVKDLLQMQKLGHPRTEWRPPVVKTSATTGEGIDELMAAVAKHRDWATQCGEAERRAADALRAEIQALMRERVLRELAQRIDTETMERVLSRVVGKQLDPYDAVDVLLATTDVSRKP